jgi:hypothetical protein
MRSISIALASLLIVGSLAAQTEFVATLDGAQEVPANASPARGKMNVTLDTATSTLGFRLVNDAFSTAVTASALHFHKGAVGVSGGIVVNLDTGYGGPTLWGGTTRVLLAAEITDLRAGLWYVNVHTTQFPAGEIRGQILAATLPTTFGTGCAGSNAKTPAITARSFPCANGSVFRINLASGKEVSNAILLVGTSKTDWAGVPLPASLAVIGMPGCTAYCNDVGLGAPGTQTDAIGAAFWPLLIPYNYSIVGATLYSQWLVFDTPANLLGLTTSNALEFKIQ